jgi:hypothetical protein
VTSFGRRTATVWSSRIPWKRDRLEVATNRAELNEHGQLADGRFWSGYDLVRE